MDSSIQSPDSDTKPFSQWIGRKVFLLFTPLWDNQSEKVNGSASLIKNLTLNISLIKIILTQTQFQSQEKVIDR